MTQKIKDHFNLLCDVGELIDAMAASRDIRSFLDKTVTLVARHLNADVGSIYMYDDQRQELVLEATVGLNPDAVGKVRMHLGEGLVGTALASSAPVREGHASQNPAFKFFEVAHEEPFESFLAVPIHRGDDRIGVLVVQDETPDYFDDTDSMALRALASQLAGTVENARLIMTMAQQTARTPADPAPRLKFVHGRSVAGGIAHGSAMVIDDDGDPLMISRPPEEFGHAPGHFARALADTSRQLIALQRHMADNLPESATLIFDAHLMILKDDRFSGRMVELVHAGKTPADAVREVATVYIERFRSSSSPYLREKAADILDLTRRILTNLRRPPEDHGSMVARRVVIARELLPSQMLKLASEGILGVVLVSGGGTAHVAILARSLKIPMVVADNPALLQVPDGTLILLDGEAGTIHVAPGEEIVSHFRRREAAAAAVAPVKGRMALETRTRDNLRICLMANINLLSELPLAIDLQAEGIGLYRTEFPFLVRSTFPTEEEQRVVYARLIEAMAGKPVTFRTLDVGGDKILPYLTRCKEPNPELGLRAIRFSLRHQDLFIQQLRAILQAGVHISRLKLMFPMIGSLDEFYQARRLLDQAKAQLTAEGRPHNKTLQVGIMVELPSAVEMIAPLTEEADFLSIGTNDLLQYLLAVDRGNDNVAEYYTTAHPAMLRALWRIVRAAVDRCKEVTVCGELGRQPEMILFLIGVGLRSFSVDPMFLPSTQRIIASIDSETAARFAAAALAETTIEGVRRVMAMANDLIALRRGYGEGPGCLSAECRKNCTASQE